jgi:hypothetical protein
MIMARFTDSLTHQRPRRMVPHVTKKNVGILIAASIPFTAALLVHLMYLGMLFVEFFPILD